MKSSSRQIAASDHVVLKACNHRSDSHEMFWLICCRTVNNSECGNVSCAAQPCLDASAVFSFLRTRHALQIDLLLNQLAGKWIQINKSLISLHNAYGFLDQT